MNFDKPEPDSIRPLVALVVILAIAVAVMHLCGSRSRGTIALDPRQSTP